MAETCFQLDHDFFACVVNVNVDHAVASAVVLGHVVVVVVAVVVVVDVVVVVVVDGDVAQWLKFLTALVLTA